MARRIRRTRTLAEMRQEYEAAEKRGLVGKDDAPRTPRASTARSGSSSTSSDREARPTTTTRMRVVWSVCDSGGRTLRSFPYQEKAQAEAFAAALKAKDRGTYFVRSQKEPFDGRSDA